MIACIESNAVAGGDAGLVKPPCHGRDGGFQPLILGPVDFASLYQQNIDKLRTQTKGDA